MNVLVKDCVIVHQNKKLNLIKNLLIHCEIIQKMRKNKFGLIDQMPVKVE